MIRVLESDEPLGVDEASLVESIFKDGGSLMQVLDFEHRAEQTEMAMAVVDSLQDGTHLLFEAGTGVGQESGLSNPISYPRGP
jgi:hypothetical protein